MSDVVLSVHPLGFVWQTFDPFLFCVHHDDAYPRGNEQMGPDASLAGRDIGQDFAGLDGWRMYHGDVVPGFPAHPHRGFETVTVVRRGLIDHSDSAGATARYGMGDVQWLTAGGGVMHAEMFPLLSRAEPNPAELFQIWLNLPRSDKMAPPHFSMFWEPSVPKRALQDARGRGVALTVIAGRYGDATPPSPPPHSWASRTDAQVAIWTLRMDGDAVFEVPAASPGLNRTIYLFRGGSARIGGRKVAPKVGVRVRSDAITRVEAGGQEVELLMLQGRPIGEPVVQHGPFVMNSADEIAQAFADYRRTRFGGWPWGRPDPVHPRDAGRFARHADGRVEPGPR